MFDLLLLRGWKNLVTDCSPGILTEKKCGLRPVLRKSIRSEIGKKRHGPVYPVMDWSSRFSSKNDR